MTTLLKYAFTCTTEATTKYVWRDEDDPAPTKCPDDTGHTIDSSSIRIVDEIDNSLVKIKEENVPTGGHFKTETVVINTPIDSTSTTDVSWKIPISALATYFVTTTAHEGDTLEMEVAPSTIIGVATANIAADDTVINVSSTVIENISLGYKVNLYDGVNNDYMGIVLAIDKDNSTITVETGAVNAFLAASPTYIMQTVSMIENYEIGPPWEWVVGESKIGGSNIPANTTIRIKYTNKSLTEAKKLVAKIEYLY